MKFGKYLAARQLEFPEYAAKFINYKALKKLIKALMLDTATPMKDKKGSFFFRLERELDKVNDFYLKKESELKFRLDILVSKKESYFESHGVRQGENNAGKINKNSVNFVSLYDGFKKFSKDLDRLEQFVELNETGFTKVLKKWDKRSKSSTKELYLSTAVNVQPVFHRSQIIELSDLVAGNLMELETLVEGGGYVKYQQENVGTVSSTPVNSHASDDLYTDFYEITLQNANLSQDDQAAKLKEWSNQIISKLPEDTKKYTLSKVFLLLIPNPHIPDESLLQFYHFFEPFVDLSFVNDLNGRTCLIEASTCKTDRNSIVELLLKSEVDSTAKDVSGRTCLHYVTENGRTDLLELLLGCPSVQPILDSMDNESISPLLLAIVNDHVTCVQTLLEHGANGFPVQDDLKPRYLPLNVACKIGNFQVVQLILARFGSPEKAREEHLLTSSLQCNAEGLLPLHIVASSGHLDLLPLLLKYGADTNQLDKLNKWSPIFYAVLKGSDSMARQLISYGADFALEDEDGCNPLYYAIWEGNVNVLNVLLEAGAETKSVRPSNSGLSGAPPLESPLRTSILDLEKSGNLLTSPSSPLALRNLSLDPPLSRSAPQTGSLLGAHDPPLHSPPLPLIDAIPDFSLPPPIIPLRKYGHNFLEKKIFLKLSFYTSRNSIQLNPDTFLTSVPGRITISCDKHDLIPRNLLLPVLDNEKSIAFQTHSLDDAFNVEFELFPTFGTRLLAKARLPSSMLTTSYPGSGSRLDGDLEIPLFDVKMRSTGFLRFNYEIVYPYSGDPLEIAMYDTYWKSSSVSEQTQTNVSFVTSSSLNGTYYRVHLFILNDGTPLVCPKYLVEVGRGVSLPTCCFNFEQLSTLVYTDKAQYEHLCTQLKSASSSELTAILSALYIPLADFLELIDPTTSLNLEIFYPSTLELQYYDIKLFTSVSSNQMLHKCNAEAGLNSLTDNCLNNFVDLILTDVFGHVRKLRQKNLSRSRSLLFSSDNSTVCTILNWKQPNYPVFYNLNGITYSDGGFKERTANGFSKDEKIDQSEAAPQEDHRNILIDNIDAINKDSSEYVNSFQHQDRLPRSIKLATEFASSNNLLGISVPSRLLQICPKMAESIRSKGLILVATREDDTRDVEANVNGMRYEDVLVFNDAIGV